MRVEQLQLRNYRCFADRQFDFAPRFNLVVGDNATGKTSLLHGVARAVGSLLRGFPAPAGAPTFDRDDIRCQTYWNNGRPNVEPQFPVRVRCDGAVNGQIKTWVLQLRKGGRTNPARADSLTQQAERMAANKPVALPVLALYGTGRVWRQRNRTQVGTAAPGSRFLGYLNCLDPSSDTKRLLEWFKTRELVALQQGGPLADLDAVRAALRACLEDADAIFWDVAADQLTIRRDGEGVRFRQLSDGYRNMLGMVADIAQRCVTLNPHLGGDAVAQTPGVVLIDEIDLHLHPKWQRRVVADLTRAFPQIQFIATTHSPFVIQSLVASDDFHLLNLDAPEANDFANKSVEDIAEQVQGAGEQTRSERYHAMMAAAEKFFRLLEQAESVAPDELQGMKNRLDELASRFSDDPAYHALLRVEREARLRWNGIAHASS